MQSQIRILDHFSTSLTITESGILRDLLAFLIQSPADFYDIGGNECRQQEQESTTAYIWIGIRIKPEIPIRILDHFC